MVTSPLMAITFRFMVIDAIVSGMTCFHNGWASHLRRYRALEVQ